MALLLLKENTTFCIANVVGKNHAGRGYACSKKTTSAPDLLGKYAVNSRYTDPVAIQIRKPLWLSARVSRLQRSC